MKTGRRTRSHDKLIAYLTGEGYMDVAPSTRSILLVAHWCADDLEFDLPSDDELLHEPLELFADVILEISQYASSEEGLGYNLVEYAKDLSVNADLPQDMPVLAARLMIVQVLDAFSEAWGETEAAYEASLN